MGQTQVGSQVVEEEEASSRETPSRGKENGKDPIGRIVSEADDDPRSPSSKFRRTPLRFFPKYGSISNRGVTSVPSTVSSENADPRSPNKEIVRTPILSSSPRRVGLRGAQKLFKDNSSSNMPEPQTEPLASKN